jgi:hypothetical protein
VYSSPYGTSNNDKKNSILGTSRKKSYGTKMQKRSLVRPNRVPLTYGIMELSKKR